MSVSLNPLHRTAKLTSAVALLCMGSLFSPALSQDVHYSLYEYSPLFLNPANTGNFNGDWRLSGNFRNQMIGTADPYRTTTIGYDRRVYIARQKLGLGLFMMNDASGIGGLTFNKVYASVAYQFEVSKNYFSVGFQAGYVFGSVNDWNNWNYNSGDFSSPSGETNFSEKARYADLNVGIQWRKSIKKIEPEIGFFLSHLNKPNISFTEGGENEDIKMGLKTRLKINISDVLFIQPSFLYIEKNISTTMLGANLGINMLGNKSSVRQITAGAYLRNGLTENMNTLAICLGTTVNRIDVGLCYDMNMGQFSESVGSTGAFEVSFIYRSISTVLNSYSIPCERY